MHFFIPIYANSKAADMVIQMGTLAYPKAILLENQAPLPDWFYPVFTPLLERAGELGEEIHRLLQSAGIEIFEEPVLILQFAIPAHDKSVSPEPESFSHQLFLYATLQKDLADDLRGVKGLSFSLYGMLFFLIYSSDNRKLFHICAQKLHTFNSRLNANIEGIISAPGHTLKDMPYLFRDITSKSQFLRYTKEHCELIASGINAPVMKINDPDFLSDVSESLNGYAKSLNAAIIDENKPTAVSVMCEALDFILSHARDKEFSEALILMINRLCDYIKNLSIEAEIADTKFWDRNNLAHALTSVSSYELCILNAKAFVDKIFDYRAIKKNDRFRKKLCDVRMYLRENANNPNMGPFLLAEHFGVQQATLALRFSNYFGETINTCLHKQRVTNAKRLLQTTDASVEEIANAVGYVSTSTMYRAFIKYEGVSPSKFSRKSSRLPGTKD